MNLWGWWRHRSAHEDVAAAAKDRKAQEGKDLTHKAQEAISQAQEVRAQTERIRQEQDRIDRILRLGHP